MRIHVVTSHPILWLAINVSVDLVFVEFGRGLSLLGICMKMKYCSE